MFPWPDQSCFDSCTWVLSTSVWFLPFNCFLIVIFHPGFLLIILHHLDAYVFPRSIPLRCCMFRTFTYVVIHILCTSQATVWKDLMIVVLQWLMTTSVAWWGRGWIGKGDDDGIKTRRFCEDFQLFESTPPALPCLAVRKWVTCQKGVTARVDNNYVVCKTRNCFIHFQVASFLLLKFALAWSVCWTTLRHWEKKSPSRSPDRCSVFLSSLVLLRKIENNKWSYVKLKFAIFIVFVAFYTEFTWLIGVYKL